MFLMKKVLNLPASYPGELYHGNFTFVSLPIIILVRLKNVFIQSTLFYFHAEESALFIEEKFIPSLTYISIY